MSAQIPAGNFQGGFIDAHARDIVHLTAAAAVHINSSIADFVAIAGNISAGLKFGAVGQGIICYLGVTHNLSKSRWFAIGSVTGFNLH